ncbi:MAG: hypothetical protein IJ532_00475 [Alphaproteobacteria bacterium]|nr:hypothetical protein [Alphaproteobacteria bacterium]
MKKIFLLLSLFLIILGTGGCQKRYAYASYREKLGSWVGRNSESLFGYWGEPQTAQDIDANTRAVTYYQTEKRPAYYGFIPYLEKIQNKTMDVVEDMGYESGRKAPPSYYCRVTFVIHNNLVSDYDYDGEDCY